MKTMLRRFGAKLIAPLMMVLSLLTVPTAIVAGAGVLMASPAQAQAQLEGVTVIGISRSRWELNFQMQWDDTLAALGTSYLGYQATLAVSTDPMFPTKDTDLRCNSKAADQAKTSNGGVDPKVGGVNGGGGGITPTQFKQIGQDVIDMWKGGTPSAGGLGMEKGVPRWNDLAGTLPKDPNTGSKVISIEMVDGSVVRYNIYVPQNNPQGATITSIYDTQTAAQAKAGGATTVCPQS